MDYGTMTLTEVCKLPGVVDLVPLKCRAAFGKALQLEARGEHEAANEFLRIAVVEAAG